MEEPQSPRHLHSFAGSCQEPRIAVLLLLARVPYVVEATDSP